MKQNLREKITRTELLRDFLNHVAANVVKRPSSQLVDVTSESLNWREICVPVHLIGRDPAD